MKYYRNKDVDDISSYYDSCRNIWSEFGKIFTNELKERNEK